MPLTAKQLSTLEDEEADLVDRIGGAVDGDEYDAMSSRLSKVGSLLDRHYQSFRKTDDGGQLTEEPGQTRQPSSSTPGSKQKEASFYFEPSLAEAREMYRKDPGLLRKLNLSEKWGTGVSVPAMTLQSPDASGYGGIPQPRAQQSFLETFSEDQEPYTALAEKLWADRLADAQARGEHVKRYKDVKARKGELGDYVKGGAEYIATRRVAPAAVGAANAASLGQAGPLYDAGREMYDYNQSRSRQIPEEHQVVTDPMTGMPMGTNETQPETYDSRNLPASSQDIVMRSPLSAMAGGIAAYALAGNPSNLIQSTLAENMGYDAADWLGKAAISGLSGSAANVLESGLGRYSEALQRGEGPIEAIPDVKDLALDSAMGFGFGAAGDAGAQAARIGRNAYREAKPELRMLFNAGGDTSFKTGVKAPPEVQGFLDEASKFRAVGSPGAIAADKLAPKIQSSLEAQQAAEKTRIGKQMEEYYGHPVYGKMKTSARPLVDAMIGLATGGRTTAPLTGQRVAFNRENIRKIKNEFGSNWAQVQMVPAAKAPEFAHANDGTVIDNDLALELFDKKVPAGQVPIVVVDPMDARTLTSLEDWIDDRLAYAKRAEGNSDTVYTTLNSAAKDMRDKFPRFEDEAGNLVPPPPETRSSQPYNPSEDLPPEPSPEGSVSVLPRPREVGEASVAPESRPGVGPGRPRMFGPFDLRAAQQGGEKASMLPRPMDVVDRPSMMYEATPGAGPGVPDVLDPFNLRQRTERIPMRGLETVPIAGGEYAEPQMVSQPDRPGIGQMRDPGDMLGPSVEPRATQQVQGSYNRPPNVEMEPAPATNRNPYGFAERGQPEPEVPLPPSERNPYRAPALGDESLSLLAGNKLAMNDAPPSSAGPTGDTGDLGAVGPGQFAVLDQMDGIPRERTFATFAEAEAEAKRLGAHFKAPSRFAPINEQQWRSGQRRDMSLEQQEIDDFLMGKTDVNPGNRERPIETAGEEVLPPGRGLPRPDERGGLEMMLDAQLENAPKANQAEIDEIGALQTADREQVAANQKAYSDNVSQAQEARSAEDKKMGELSQKQASEEKGIALANDVSPEGVEEAKAFVDNMDKRLGPIPDNEKQGMIASILSKKLGRTVTVQDLVDAGLLGGGLAVAATDDDDAGPGSAAMMFGMGRMFRGKKAPVEEAPKLTYPREPEAVLDDGRKVKGFSALRRQQHLAQGGIETAKQRVGATGDKTIRDRIIGFNRGDDKIYDDALLAEAKRIGAEDELWKAAAAAGWLDLKNRHFLGTKGEGLVSRVADTAGPRLDRVAGILSGAGRNPLDSGPQDIMEHLWRAGVADPGRRFFDISRGSVGARYGNDAVSLYNLLFGDESQEEEQPSP